RGAGFGLADRGRVLRSRLSDQSGRRPPLTRASLGQRAPSGVGPKALDLSVSELDDVDGERVAVVGAAEFHGEGVAANHRLRMLAPGEATPHELGDHLPDVVTAAADPLRSVQKAHDQRALQGRVLVEQRDHAFHVLLGPGEVHRVENGPGLRLQVAHGALAVACRSSVAIDASEVLPMGHPKVAATPARPSRSASGGDGREGGQGWPKGPGGTGNSGTWVRVRVKSSASARLFAVWSRTVRGSSPQRHSIMRSTEV